MSLLCSAWGPCLVGHVGNLLYANAGHMCKAFCAHLSAADDEGASGVAAILTSATAAAARCGSGTGCTAVAEPLDDVNSVDTGALLSSLLPKARAAPYR